MRDWAWKHSLAIIIVPEGEQMVAGTKENKNLFSIELYIYE